MAKIDIIVLFCFVLFCFVLFCFVDTCISLPRQRLRAGFRVERYKIMIFNST